MHRDHVFFLCLLTDVDNKQVCTLNFLTALGVNRFSQAPVA